MLEKIEKTRDMIAEIKEVLKACSEYNEFDEKIRMIFYRYESKYDINVSGDWDVTEEFAWCEIEVKINEDRNSGKISIKLEEPKA